jgi:hypothetical protein
MMARYLNILWAVALVSNIANAASPDDKTGDAAALVRQVDVLHSEGYKVKATFPIFHQIVALSFPQNFVPAFEQTRGSFYIQESVLSGETVDQWTQMISITGRQGAATNPQNTADRLASFIAEGYKKACPDTFSGLRIPSGELAKYSATVVVLSCGNVTGHGSEHSESVVLITLKGDEDYYTVQWAERGPASKIATSIDEDHWKGRISQLMPILVCDRIPDEPPPFVSCIGEKKP